MKLRNKKTGEIADLSEGFIRDTYNGNMIQIKPVAISNKEGYVYGSLAELNAEWEDAPEEPKKYWFIDAYGNIVQNEITKHYGDEYIDMTDAYESQKQIGNYFETEEEAEKAVEKLKAWKRLKDKGFRFLGYYHRLGETKSKGEIGFEMDDYEGTKQDLNLLFGGEE